MQIRVETQSEDLTAEGRQHVEGRVRFVMRRMRAQVMQVHVRLSDVNGPRGGVDQREVHARHREPIAVTLVHCIRQRLRRAQREQRRCRRGAGCGWRR